MTATVHATAVISPRAELGEDVEVGPYAVVGDDVRVGAGTRIGAHASLQGPATIGRENRIFDHALLGGEPQDVHYRGEPTRLIVGDRNVFREFSTVHRGTPTGRSETTVGNDNYFMAYTHVAHDCRVGSQCVFANYAALAGHIEVGRRGRARRLLRRFTSSSASATTPSWAPTRWDARTSSRSAGPTGSPSRRPTA